MTDRDTFAAAALTGLIVSMREESMYEVCESAYGWADAMIRQTVGGTNHDAAPAAKARTDAESIRTDKAEPLPGKGTGDSPEPVAWALVYPNDEVAVIAFRRQDAAELASASDRVVPLYRQPQPTLTDAEREAVEAALGWCDDRDTKTITTLRRLLERTK